jgi:osmotically-inducible protein OsmY
MTRTPTGRARLAATLPWLLAAALLPAALTGCTPLVVGGAAATVLAATDRRTLGAQADDTGIELKAATAWRDAGGDRGNVNVISYNRMVLLAGEVPTEADRQLAAEVVGKVSNVRSIVNELAVMGNSSIASRSNDALITAKVKASLVEAKDVFASTIKVYTERSIVYLMGLVTEREANRAAEIAARVGGVQRVIKVFEIISEDELRRMSTDPSNARPTPPPSR